MKDYLKMQSFQNNFGHVSCRYTSSLEFTCSVVVIVTFLGRGGKTTRLLTSLILVAKDGTAKGFLSVLLEI